MLHKVTSIILMQYIMYCHSIGVVEVILHPGHKAEFDRMGDLLGTLIDDIAPLIEASILSLDKFKTYLGRCR